MPGARGRAHDPASASAALEGVRIAWVGDGTNVLVSLAHLARLTGMEVVAACPEGYEPPAGDAARARARPARGRRAAPTSSSPTSGSRSARRTTREQRLRDLEPYRLDEALVALAAPHAIVLHCLPAHPGEEITPGRALRRPLGRLGRGREPSARPEGAARADARIAMRRPNLVERRLSKFMQEQPTVRSAAARDRGRFGGRHGRRRRA